MILNYLEKLIDVWFSLLPRPRPTQEQACQAHLIAHRGAHDDSLGIQENTDAAFARALELGCWGIELDIHACADGVLVINHDPTLQRLWEQNIEIVKHDFKSIRTLVPQLPSLEDIVDKYGKQLHLFIELKSAQISQKILLETLKSLTPCKDYHLLSLDEPRLQAFNQFPRDSLLLVPLHNNVEYFCKLSMEKSYGGVLGHYLLLRDSYIKTLKTAKQIAGVGFVDSKYSLYRELNRGLRFLFTNKAAATSAFLQELTK
ncbi:glycerophosphodiester phosphodiesterase [Legionella nagasakiensis]|uniref:glycerophosphodiester phosphodiesterase n=1 Tax=Legionella nagasakiensis TaxID=535290 RepID=UPI001056AE51|nr:glycerophosphodiester phosphodiesterase family protein [Legionella nagasakiensis]